MVEVRYQAITWKYMEGNDSWNDHYFA